MLRSSLRRLEVNHHNDVQEVDINSDVLWKDEVAWLCAAHARCQNRTNADTSFEAQHDQWESRASGAVATCRLVEQRGIVMSEMDGTTTGIEREWTPVTESGLSIRTSVAPRSCSVDFEINTKFDHRMTTKSTA